MLYDILVSTEPTSGPVSPDEFLFQHGCYEGADKRVVDKSEYDKRVCRH